MRDQFRSDLRIGKVRAPVLVVHGENDTVVPISLGERLYGLVRMPKRLVRVAGAGHNDLGAHAVAAAKGFIAEQPGGDGETIGYTVRDGVGGLAAPDLSSDITSTSDSLSPRANEGLR